MTTLIRRPNGRIEEIQEPPSMSKSEYHKWKHRITLDGTRFLNEDEEYKYKTSKMKVSKVKAVQANGTWESNYGLMYKFEYVMEDGQIVNANHTQNKHLDIGTEVEYKITDTQYNNGKVKKYNPEYASSSFTPKQDSNDVQIRIAAAHAVNNATNLTCAIGKGDYFDEFEAIKQRTLAFMEITEWAYNQKLSK